MEAKNKLEDSCRFYAIDELNLNESFQRNCDTSYYDPRLAIDVPF